MWPFWYSVKTSERLKEENMKRKIVLWVVVCLLIVTVAACKPEPPPPPPPENLPPPEPTPEEHRQQTRMMLGALLQSGVPAPADDLIPGVLSSLQGRKAQLSATENGRTSLGLTCQDIAEGIRVSKQEEQWRKLAALCRAFRVMEPDNTRYEKQREYADLMVKRPEITITGFMELDNELYVFVDLFDPANGQKTNYRVREGEEFNGNMRLIKIIGNQQSIEVEYLPLSYSWECLGPKKRDAS
jgi:hypothetical protein